MGNKQVAEGASAPSQPLTREQILQASKPKTILVPIEALGGSVLIRKLSAAKAREMQASLDGPTLKVAELAPRGKRKRTQAYLDALDAYGNAWAEFTVELIAFCAVDENCKQLYSVEDVRNLDPDVEKALGLAVLDYNGFQLLGARARDELKKNQNELETSS